MSSGLVSVSFETPDPAAAGAFWAAVLGRTVIEEPRGVLVPGDPTQVGLRFSGRGRRSGGRTACTST